MAHLVSQEEKMSEPHFEPTTYVPPVVEGDWDEPEQNGHDEPEEDADD